MAVRTNLQWRVFAGVGALLTCGLLLAGCAAQKQASEEPAESVVTQEAPVPPQKEQKTEAPEALEEAEEEVAMGCATMTIDGQAYVLELADTEAARAFATLMPLDLELRDVNGNEKFTSLEQSLPTDVYAPGHLEAGDVMLYGGDGLVLFYESFDSSYSYTRLGNIADEAAIAALSSAGSVQVRFEG